MVKYIWARQGFDGECAVGRACRGGRWPRKKSANCNWQRLRFSSLNKKTATLTKILPTGFR